MEIEIGIRSICVVVDQLKKDRAEAYSEIKGGLILPGTWNAQYSHAKNNGKMFLVAQFDSFKYNCICITNGMGGP